MSSGKRFLISIDGGGSKTGICVYDCENRTRFCDVCGGGNYKVHGIETVKERISECLERMIPDAENVPEETRFLVLGLSGCDSPRDEEIYAEMITSLGFDRDNILICNDSEMIFRSLADAPGICVIAGTGTIALSFERDGGVQRAGGWGAPLSDEGSGYWIGAEMLRRYLSWVDGTGPFNEIFAGLDGAYPDNSAEEIAAEIGSLSPDQVADWAITVFDGVSENSLCETIVRAAGHKAAELAVSVYRKSGFSEEQDLTIVESGSLFKNDLYEKSFREALKSLLPDNNYAFIRSDGIPAEDGIRLAEKMAAGPVITQSCD